MQSSNKHPSTIDETIAAISTLLTAAPTSDLDNAIDAALRTVGTALQADRIYLALLAKDEPCLSCSYEWCASGIPSYKATEISPPQADFPWRLTTVTDEDGVRNDIISDLPMQVSANKLLIYSSSVHSLMAARVVDEDRVIGLVGIEVLNRAPTWPEDNRHLLHILAALLAGALHRRSLQKEQIIEERYRHYVDTVDSLIAVVDHNVCLLYANDAFARALKTEKSTLPGKHISELSPYEFPKMETDIRQVLASGQSISSERFSFFPDPAHWYRVDLQPVRDASGAPIAVVVNLLDMTAQKQQAHDQMQERFELERFANLMSLRFVGLQFDRAHSAIQQTLADVGAFANVDCVQLYCTNDAFSELRAEYHWCATKPDGEQGVLPGTVLPELTWSIERLRCDGVLTIADVDALPVEAHNDKVTYARANIRSLLALAHSYVKNDQVVIGLSTLNRSRIWKQFDRQLLRLVGDILAKAFERWRNEMQLNELNRTLEIRFAESKLEALRLARAMETISEGMAIVRNSCFIYVNPAFARMYGYTPEELSGQSWTLLVPFSSDDPLVPAIGAALRAQSAWTGVTTARTKQGDLFDVEVNLTLVEDELLLVVRNVTGRIKAERALRRAEERYRSLFEDAPVMYATLGEDSLGIPVITDCNRQFLTTLGYTREEIVGRWLGHIHTPESRKHLCERFMGGDARLLMAEECELVTSSGKQIRALLQTRRDTDAEGQFTQAMAMYVDITALKEAEDRLRQISNQYRTLAQRLVAAREEERARIALQIHDDLGQMLTVLKLDTDWLANKLPQDTPWLTKRLESMRELIGATINSVRQLSSDLRPNILDTLGLAPAMAWQLQQFSERTELATSFDTNLPEAMQLPPALSTALFRILQESLTNVIRHARANRVDVSLALVGEWLRLVVCDDGCGIDPVAAAGPNSLGVVGMRERLAPWQGTLELSSAPNGGAMVRAEVPVAAIFGETP